MMMSSGSPPKVCWYQRGLILRVYIRSEERCAHIRLVWSNSCRIGQALVKPSEPENSCLRRPQHQQVSELVGGVPVTVG